MQTVTTFEPLRPWRTHPRETLAAAILGAIGLVALAGSSDAMPLLRRARTVRVLSIDAVPSEEGHGDVPGADIALFLARHGVNAVATRTPSAGIEAGDVILSHAADHSNDLIVMGAYGHSRLLQLVMGGATRTALRQMTVPVLMSH